MKKLVMLVGVAALATAASFSAPPLSGAADVPAPARQGEPVMAPERFPELKARLLERLEERLKRTQAEKACIEAAKSYEDLQKCRPERPAPPRQEAPDGAVPRDPLQIPPIQPMPPRQPGAPK